MAAMTYRITHATRYVYSDVVPVCQNQVCLAPRTLPHQVISRFQLSVQPEPAEVLSRRDAFGNRIDQFSILEPHTQLSVTSTCDLQVERKNKRPVESIPGWSQLAEAVRTQRTAAALEAYQYVFPSPYVPVGEQPADYARPSFSPGASVLDAAIDLTRRIHEDFEYDPSATSLSTPVEEVLSSRRGVCQDFAHLQLACFRSWGIPARYVSGYLRTVPPAGQPRLQGADASHAWISVYVGKGTWLDFDPTNNIRTNQDHITVGWGRDYGDVCPVRGVFVGGGQHSLEITVDVEPRG